MSAWARNAAVLILFAGALFALVFEHRQVAAPCAAQTFEGDSFTVCAYRPAVHALQLFWADKAGQGLRSFEALAASGIVDTAHVRFAMNAGMFDTTGAPVGLFVASGREDHPLNQQTGSGNFYMQPNGVFGVGAGGEAFILTTPGFARSGALPLWATQSGPMLVIGGAVNPTFGDDGPSRNLRNGVGVVSPGLAYFVISEAPVSFGKFARFFRDALKCRDALYLDGAVSSLWVPSLGRRDDNYSIGPMVIVSDRVKRPVSARVVPIRW